MGDSSDSSEARVCRECNEERELADFRLAWQTRNGKFGRARQCNECNRNAALKVYHLRKSAGPPSHRCEICHRMGRMQLDQNHVTGEFRGWLCGTCNRGLGMLGDDIEGLCRALAYLARSTASSSGSDVEERVRSHSPRRHGDSGGANAAGSSEYDRSPARELQGAAAGAARCISLPSTK
jgi:hypothetical protein